MIRRPRLSWQRWPLHPGALAALSLLLLASVPAEAAASFEAGELDCRYDPDAPVDWTTVRPELLVNDDPFRPLLAAPKEGRPAAMAARIRMSGNGVEGGARSFQAGIVTIGGTMGLWGAHSLSSCAGVQVGLSAAVFAQFDLSAEGKDLLNADYDAALPVTVRHGPYSARLRLVHESSHLGDQFVLASPGVRRLDLSHELVDLMLSYERGFARLYLGGGYIFHSKINLSPLSAQGGLELRGPGLSLRFWGSPSMRPVAGVDVSMIQQRHWQASTSVVAGVEVHQPGTESRLRVVGAYQHGYWPFGQFSFTETVDSFGLQMQYEL
jgi:hypothetical protein